MDFTRYLVIFRNDKIPSDNKEAYSVKEFDIPKSYSDDPIGWVVQEHSKENIHVVLCVPMDGRQHIANLISGK